MTPSYRIWNTMTALVTCAALAGCGGDEGTRVTGLVCSDAAVPGNSVALVCGPLVTQETRIVSVVLDAGVAPCPNAPQDVMAIAFDVVYDPALLTFVPGSEAQGTLLSQSGNLPILTAALQNGQEGRLVISISRTNTTQGAAAQCGSNLVLSFALRSFGLADFDPHLLRFESTLIQDSQGAPVPGIMFVDQLTLSFVR